MKLLALVAKSINFLKKKKKLFYTLFFIFSADNDSVIFFLFALSGKKLQCMFGSPKFSPR